MSQHPVLPPISTTPPQTAPARHTPDTSEFEQTEAEVMAGSPEVYTALEDTDAVPLIEETEVITEDETSDGRVDETVDDGGNESNEADVEEEEGEDEEAEQAEDGVEQREDETEEERVEQSEEEEEDMATEGEETEGQDVIDMLMEEEDGEAS